MFKFSSSFESNSFVARAATVLGSVALIAGTGLLAGCPSNSSTAPTTATAQTAAFHDTVYGGRQPISGATVSAYEATSGTAAPLIATTATAQNGSFTMDISSTPPGAIVYVVAAGGNSQSYAPSSTTTNDAIKLTTVAGAYCDSGTAGCSFPDTVQMNELSTAATAYAMARFLHLDSYVDIHGNATGLHNAAKTFANLVNAASGQQAIPGATDCSASGGAANCDALRTLDTLANIAAACVNGESSGANSCSNLFTETTPSSSLAPGDTFAALYNIVTDAGGVRNNTNGIFGLSPTTTIFSPTLTAAPSAWTLALNITGGGLNTPRGIAIDAYGNVWVANFNSTVIANSLSAFSNNGTPLAGSPYTNSGLNQVHGIAIDSVGKIWIASTNARGINEFDPAGVTWSTYAPGFTAFFPYGIAAAPDGNIWSVSSNAVQLGKFDPGGSTWLPSGSTGYTGGGLSTPFSVAVDANVNVWTTSQHNNTVNEFNGSTGTAISPTAGYGGGGLNMPNFYSIAIGPDGNVWTSSQNNNSVNEFVGGSTPAGTCSVPPASTDTGCPLSPSTGYTSGGLNAPNGIAMDADGNAWIASHGNSTVNEFDNNGVALSPTTGYTGGGLNAPYGIAIDSSGNVWVANYGSGATGTLTELIGVAAPTRTPIVSAIDIGFNPGPP